MRTREAAQMRAKKAARLRMDEEMRPFRHAAKEKNPTNALLRTARKVLEIPAGEIAQKLGVSRNVIFDLEEREGKGTAKMQSLARLAEAMDCMVVYGVVPRGGRTFERAYEARLWGKILGDAGTEGPREQGN
jgi:transcriptional regulator with XRE-family HTH domain